MVLRLRPLFERGSHASLDFTPTVLTTSEIVVLILFFLFKSIFNGLTLLIVGTGSQRRGKLPKIDIPKLSISMPFTVTEDDISLYAIATGCKQAQIDDQVPQKLLFLSAITEPAMLLLIAKRGSPIQPLGSVNVRNKFEILRPDLCSLSDLLSLKSGSVFATLGSPARIAKRGIEYDLDAEIRIEEAPGSPLVPIFRQTFTMLQFTKISSTAKLSETARQPDFQFPMGSSIAEKLDIGWKDPTKWARLCKDFNPIHISSIAAKLFGLPGKIAHGNHVVAIALGTLLDSRDPKMDLSRPYRMEVSFKRPVTVPNKLDLFVEPGVRKEALVTHFAVGKGDKIYVQGKYQPA